MSTSAVSGPTTAIRGRLVYFIDDPWLEPVEECMVYEPDGMVVMRDGRILAVGDAATIRAGLRTGSSTGAEAEAEVEVRRWGGIIMPGFVDTHVHYVQSGIVGSHGHQLLEWLERYAFPAERAFADPAHAAREAEDFCEQLLRHGTTSALVFCAVFPQSVEALFEAAERRDMRLVAGKVMMDRNAPPELLDTAQSSYDDSKALIERWHERGRCLYAVTPRFAPTSSPEQLDAARTLRREHPGVFLHSHLSESRAELAQVRELFPDRQDYLDVYDHHGLLGDRAVYAHGVHLSEREFGRCHETGTALAHCPTSNLFLGSGLFGLEAAKDPARPVEVGLGTDIGAGTSFSMLTTAGEAYKVAQLRGLALDAPRALYLATLGGARALDLDDRIGSLRPGLEADLVVLDPAATPLLASRTATAASVAEELFALMILGDDRAVSATYVAGELAYERP